MGNTAQRIGKLVVKRAGGIEAIKRHEIVNKKGIIQIIIACVLAMVAMMLIQAVIPVQSNILSVLISGIVYVVVAFIALALFKNEYASMILKRLHIR